MATTDRFSPAHSRGRKWRRSDPGKNGPHKVFLRHTQLSARLYETFHCEHNVTSLAGTLQSKICLFDDTGEDVCYVESKKS